MLTTRCVETLNATVDRELGALSVDMRAWFARILIAAVGPERVGAPHVRRLAEPDPGSPIIPKAAL